MNKHQQNYNISISEDLRQQLQMISNAAKIPTSQYIRHALIEIAISNSELTKSLREAMKPFENISFNELKIQINSDLIKSLEQHATKYKLTLNESLSHLASRVAELDRSLSTPNQQDIYAKIDFNDQNTRSQIIQCSPSVRLLLDLQHQKINLHDLNWRQFEEVIAELLSKDGYNVQIGKGIKDGGCDIIATRHLPNVGDFMTVWQAKHLKQGKKV